MKKLFRSRHDSKLFGLCGGIASYFGVDSTLVRLLFAALAILSCGTALFFYFVGSLIVPREPFGHTTVLPPQW